MREAVRRIAETVASVERELGLDWRSSYAGIEAREDAIEVAVSRDEVFRALAGRYGGAPAAPGGAAASGAVPIDIPGAGRPARLRLIAPPPERTLWVGASVADVRREPSHAAELVTQLIMGETAIPLRTEGDWYFARLADDYHGWVRSWHVRESGRDAAEAFDAAANAVVEAGVAYVRTAPDEGAIPVSDVVFGTRLRAEPGAEAYRRVALPGGREGYLRASEIAPYPPAGAPDRARLAERAMRLLGIPYVWGGTSAKGFDCSGLVKRLFLMEGIRLPRDSDRQALVGELVPRDLVGGAAAGDLLFFGESGKVTHVALHLGERAFVHAYGEVRINSLDPADGRYDERLARIFLFGRRVIPL